MGDGQHFLLSAKARTLSLGAIFKMSDDAALEEFKKARWHATDGNPVCFHCGGYQCYEIRTRRIWKCSQCRRQFSVTSGTIFASRKLSFQRILAAIALYVNGAKGKSMLELSRDLSVQYKTAFVLCHKLREAIATRQAEMKLSGTVEMDAAWFGDAPRPANLVQDRKKKPVEGAEEAPAKKERNQRAILVMRERKGNTVVVALKSEHDRQGIASAAATFIAPGTEIHADEHPSYNALRARYKMKRINHSGVGFSHEGACTNQAESFFSRLRRSEIGQHHHFSRTYLYWYAAEMTFREDTRRYDNKTIWERILRRALNHPVSRNLAGYWQGIHPPGEMLWNPT